MGDRGEEIPDIQKEVEVVKASFHKALAEVKDSPEPDRVEAFRLAFLGRKGSVPMLLELLRASPKELRPQYGKVINELKTAVEEAVQSLEVLASQWTLGKELASPPLDVSLPVEDSAGSLHPVTLMRRELIREFRRMGFTVWDGPELDFEFYNFNALNIPEHHPARDMQDTFYIRSLSDFSAKTPPTDSSRMGRLLLRTHTSNLQIHAMLADRPPLRVVAPGRVFRVDSDPTHTPMFHQIEAFIVDRGIHFGHLKGVISAFMKSIFGASMKTRLRPSYFPFVEPGAEIDIQCVHCSGKGCRICKDTGWVEIGGAGMIHPNVFEAVDLDSEIYTGFAFGFGIDRMAMMKYKVPDLRQLFEGSVTYLRQYPMNV